MPFRPRAAANQRCLIYTSLTASSYVSRKYDDALILGSGSIRIDERIKTAMNRRHSRPSRKPESAGTKPMRANLTLLLLPLVSSCCAFARNDLNGAYIATAYSDSGITASGEYTHRHVVAADPAVLPLGTRIKIKSAGRYSGEYVVADTGAKIVGRRLDIYMPSEAAAIQFGVHRVRVKIISLGDGTHASTKQADRAVKADVAKDVANGANGEAATTEDVAAKKAAGKQPAREDGAQRSTDTAENRQDLPRR